MSKLTAITVLMVFVIILTPLSVAAAKGEQPTTTSSAPAEPKLQWGVAKAGLQLSLSQTADVAVGGKFPIRLSMRNVGSLGVQLGPVDKAFAWLAVAHSRDKAWLSAKIPASNLLSDWPAILEGGKRLSGKDHDAISLQIYPYRFRKQILENYLGYPKAAKLPPTEEKLTSVVSEGKLSVRCRLYVNRQGQKPIIVTSNKLSVEVAPPALKSMTPEARKAYLDGLIVRFNENPWAGQEAHRIAVRIGPDVVPHLIKAVNERKRPAHARMWLATALADIRDDRAAEALISLLQDSLAGVRHVVVYHGPKQRNKKLDDAIVARTLKLKESRMTALAVLGFLISRGQVVDELLNASLNSDDPRVRATAAGALSQHASVDNLKRLAALLKDKDQKVRSAAAGALGAMGRGGDKVINALVTALDLPGDTAKYRICGALVALTGQKIVYDPQASPQDRAKTVTAWKNWWQKKYSNKHRR